MAKKATKRTGKRVKAVKKTKAISSPRMMTNPEIKEDKEFRELLPPLADDVRKALEESIHSEGLREPLIVWKENGILILVDGYNRYKFCKKHKKDYRVIVKSFTDREEVKLWMWENQESRRNMTPYQRIEVVLKFEGIVRERAKKNQQAAGGAVCEIVNKAKVDQIRTNDVLGKRAGVSYATVGKVKDIQRKIADGVISQEELGRLREGKATINSIYNQYKDKKVKKQSDKNITERSNSFIKFLKMHLAKAFPQVDDRDYIYKQISEWLNENKD